MLAECIAPGEGVCSTRCAAPIVVMGRVCVLRYPVFSGPGSSNRLISGPRERGRVRGATGGGREELRDLEPVVCL